MPASKRIASSPDPTQKTGMPDRLTDLLDRQVASYLELDPELSSMYAVPEQAAGGAYAHRLTDYSPAAEAERRALVAGFARELTELGPAGLDPDQRHARDSAIWVSESMERSRDIEYGRQYPYWYYGHAPYVVSQISGPHIDIPNMMVAKQAIATPEDADAYLERLNAFERTFEGVVEKIRFDAAHGVRPPGFLIDRTLEVLDLFVEPPAAEHPLVTSLDQKLETARLAEKTRRRVGDQATSAVEAAVYPAYAKLRAALAALRSAAGRDAGVWALPQGERLYQAAIHTLGGSEKLPKIIHQQGLDLVEEILTDLDTKLRAVDSTSGSVVQRLNGLSEDVRFKRKTAEASDILEDLKEQISTVTAVLPEYFTRAPTQALDIRPVPPFQEQTAPPGFYTPPSLDGSQAGVYNVNLRSMADLASWTTKTLTYHEAVPGHHLQISTALASNPPLARRISPINAYTEGWGVYAELLASEMGLYDADPFGEIGRLMGDLFRAVRLVLDTAVHHGRWSRERAIEYLQTTAGKSKTESSAEAERYMAWPGQALGYKLGQLSILRIREEARTALADAFDVRDFHDVVLGNGAMPMDVLESAVKTWRESTQSV